MKVRTDQGTVIDIDNGAGSVPTKGTAAAATAGFGVPAGQPGAININTKDIAKDAAKPEAPAAALR